MTLHQSRPCVLAGAVRNGVTGSSRATADYAG